MSNRITVLTGTTVQPMVGSLLVSFDEYTNDLGGNFVTIRIEGFTRATYYLDNSNIYSYNILKNNIVNISITASPSGSRLRTISVYKQEYTNDDVNGDNGIKTTFVTSTSGGPSGTSTALTFTVSPSTDCYNFRYLVYAKTELP